MVFSEITWFGNYCSLIIRPETLQMQTAYEVNKGVKVCEYSRSRSFHDDLILQDQASGERSQDQWSSGLSFDPKHRLWVLVRTASAVLTCTLNQCLRINIKI